MNIWFGTLTLCFLQFSYISAQIQDTIYLDTNWEVSTYQKASYFRFINKEKGRGYHVKDFHMGGQLQMEGTYKDKKLKKKEGNFTWYFKNGNIDRKGAFLKNKKTVPWKWHFREGPISAE